MPFEVDYRGGRLSLLFFNPCCSLFLTYLLLQTRVWWEKRRVELFWIHVGSLQQLRSFLPRCKFRASCCLCFEARDERLGQEVWLHCGSTVLAHTLALLSCWTLTPRRAGLYWFNKVWCGVRIWMDCAPTWQRGLCSVPALHFQAVIWRSASHCPKYLWDTLVSVEMTVPVSVHSRFKGTSNTLMYLYIIFDQFLCLNQES